MKCKLTNTDLHANTFESSNFGAPTDYVSEGKTVMLLVNATNLNLLN